MKKVQFLEKLSKRKIRYFSFSLLKKEKHVIDYCNNSSWFDYYSMHYHKHNVPPVQKYILSSGLSVIEWNDKMFDASVRYYISLRNQVVEVVNNITVLDRNADYIAVFTFGTKEKNSQLYDFLNKDLDCIKDIKKALVPILYPK